ncbi:hypothetical protein CAPTEDRAFT_171191 [Capitella teleta]|uniref:Major facilitator superfamily (MFS) profile domain-containing protein n=1 Tax=Capitella teleta TaxID=283909 RepID=R7VHW0_CAPTE|nr:hypothetical protein CAPTEDRAFT_171191 [Capitella teleta]|eukprot:ELU15285.1 hypothetical protein CAPTEDRAFT_171191 [Capitella teleta]
MVRALDGGWGWIVLFASFLNSVILDGVCFSFGIFFLEYLDHFQENKGKTAWIGSVLNGTYMIMGPIAGALANKFGCRPVTIVGSIWSTIAFFASTYSPNINVLILTYGVLGGMGFGLMYLPAIVIVGFYFDKRRAFATGIATCGSGIGAFVFAPLCQVLIQTYAWRGAQWIIAGLVLNGVIIGAVFRPLTHAESDRHHGRTRKLTVCSYEEENVIYTRPDVTASKAAEVLSKAPTPNEDHISAVASSHNLSVISSCEHLHESLPSNTLHTKSNNKVDSCMHVIKDLFKEVSKSMDVSVLKNPVFVVYGVSCILCMKGFFVPFIYLVDKAVETGYSKTHAAMLLSMLGITNTVGRVVAGWVSDRPWADCLLINNVALIVGGLSTMAVPFLDEYWMLVAYATVFGLCIAAFVSLRSVILVDLIGIQRLTSSFGILVMCQGISSFVGAPIAGSLFDLTGSYNVSFFVAGVSIALAGLICLPLRRLHRWDLNRKSGPHEAAHESLISMDVKSENSTK